MELILVAILAILLGAVLGYFLGARRAQVEREEIEERIRKEAEAEAGKILERAREEPRK